MQNPAFVGRMSRLEGVASIFVGMTVFKKGVSAKKWGFPNLRYEKSVKDILNPPQNVTAKPLQEFPFHGPKRLLEMDHLSSHGWLSEMVGSDRYRQCHLATLYRQHGIGRCVPPPPRVVANGGFTLNWRFGSNWCSGCHFGEYLLIFANHLKQNRRTWYTLRLLWGLSMVILCFSLPRKKKTKNCVYPVIFEVLDLLQEVSTNCLSPVIQ